MAVYGENSKGRRCRHPPPRHATRQRAPGCLTHRPRPQGVPQYVRRLRRALQPARVGFLPHDQSRSFRGGTGGRAKSGAGFRAHDAHTAISHDTRICYSWSTAVAHSLEHPLTAAWTWRNGGATSPRRTAGKFFASACGKRRWWNGFGRRLDADVHWASEAFAERIGRALGRDLHPRPQIARRGRSSGTRGNGVIWYCPRFCPVFRFSRFSSRFSVPVFPRKQKAPPTTPFPRPTLEPA
jgi:hypothetical protein